MKREKIYVRRHGSRQSPASSDRQERAFEKATRQAGQDEVREELDTMKGYPDMAIEWTLRPNSENYSSESPLFQTVTFERGRETITFEVQIGTTVRFETASKHTYVLFEGSLQHELSLFDVWDPERAIEELLTRLNRGMMIVPLPKTRARVREVCQYPYIYETNRLHPIADALNNVILALVTAKDPPSWEYVEHELTTARLRDIQAGPGVYAEIEAECRAAWQRKSKELCISKTKD